jgi:pyridinium-3,5-bisthiocarboxylic acid mononucleotide nickel chelatase
MKVGYWHAEEMNAAPEFEDCRRAAEACDVPLKTVMQAALAQWRREAPRTEQPSPAAKRSGAHE